MADRDFSGLKDATREAMPAAFHPVPRHVAVIMDGNGRWAARRGLPRIEGHRRGVEALRRAVRAAIELGVRYLTVYSFSSENWNRPPEEIDALMGLFVEVLRAKMSELMRKGVRVRVIGRLDEMPLTTAQAFRDAMDRTSANDQLDLIVALNYGGRAEIVDAARALCVAVADGELLIEDIREPDLAERLYTAGIPDPDLVVRTSGEMRISNFLLWQVAYAEIHVTAVLWPDFGRGDLLRAILDFQGRDRRFGGR
jgi:undecaprenyl diphosphate synthase